MPEHIEKLYVQRIRDHFNRQGLMKTLNGTLVNVMRGEVTIAADFSNSLTQEHGYFHAGVATSILDSACGFAALTIIPPDKQILTVEFKINFLKPAQANRLIATGTVLQSGKTLTICEGWVFDESGQKLIARMNATMISIGMSIQNDVK